MGWSVYQYAIGKKDLFAVVIALRYLIDNQEFKQFKAELKQLIHSVRKNCPHISQELLFSKMGFPEKWEKIMCYKKQLHDVQSVREVTPCFLLI